MRKTLLSLALLSLLAAPALAYDMSDLRRDMKAHIADVMKDVGDVTMVHEATFDVPDAGMKSIRATTYRKGNRWRSEAMMQGSDKTPAMEVTSLFDGTDMWSLTMGMKHKLPSGTTGQATSSSMWTDFPENAKVVGEEKVGGRDTWKVQYGDGAKKNGDGATTMWLDKTTFIPIQSESQLSGKVVRTVMSDFRKVKGHEMPYLTEMFSGGKKAMTMKVVKLETGKGLSDELFDPDQLAGGDGMDMNEMMKKAMEMQKQMEGKKGGK